MNTPNRRYMGQLTQGCQSKSGSSGERAVPLNERSGGQELKRLTRVSVGVFGGGKLSSLLGVEDNVGRSLSFRIDMVPF